MVTDAETKHRSLWSYLAPVLSPTEYAYIGFNEPYEAVRDGAGRCFMFCIPGIWFMLSVGKTISSDARDLSITAPGNPLVISRSIGSKGQETAFSIFKGARRTKAYEKALEKVRVEESARSR